MKNFSETQRYAKAVYRLAHESKSLDVLERDFLKLREILSTKFSIDISFQLKFNGGVYCKIIETATIVEPVSMYEVSISSFQNTILNFTTMVFPLLTPSTEYSIYCFTEAPIQILDYYPFKVVPFRSPIFMYNYSTQCCKSVFLDVSIINI